MTEDLHPPCPSQQEEVAKGGIVAPSYLYVLAMLHELRIEAADDGPPRVVGHIAHHGGEMARVIVTRDGVGQADGIVVVVVEEGALRLGMGGVVLGSLLAAHVM